MAVGAGYPHFVELVPEIIEVRRTTVDRWISEVAVDGPTAVSYSLGEKFFARNQHEIVLQGLIPPDLHVDPLSSIGAAESVLTHRSLTYVGVGPRA